MADMFDCGGHTFTAWAGGCAFHARWLGSFNREMTAQEAWRLMDCEGKLRAEAFAPFERGWNDARTALPA